MIKELFKKRYVKVFTLLSLLFFITMIVIESINERFWLHDLEVMYSAADALLSNEQVYGKYFGLTTGYYKYSPFTLFLFVPYTFLPYKIACVLHFFIVGFSAISSVLLLDKMIRKYIFNYPKKYYLTLFATLIAIIIHLVRDLHLGNINVILIFLIMSAVYFLLESKYIKFAIILGVVIITKPYFIVLIVPLLLHKYYKAIVSLAIVGVSFVLVSLMLIGFSKGVDLYFNWFAAMLDHTSYLTSNNTIFYIINRYTGVLIGSKHAFLLLGLISVISSLFFWLFIRTKEGITESKRKKNQAVLFQVSILIALIPNVFITDTEHFIFSLPVLAILILYFSIKKRFVWIPLLVFMIFLYGGNSTDLMGDYINENYKQLGLLGIGNLALILTTVIIYVKNNRIWDKE